MSGCIHQSEAASALTAALAEAAGATLDDMECVAQFHSGDGGATHGGFEAGAPAKMVVRLREGLLVLLSGIGGEVGPVKLKIQVGSQKHCRRHQRMGEDERRTVSGGTE